MQSAFTAQALRKLCLIGPTLIETLKKAETFFADKGIPSPRLEAQLIFAHFLKLRRIDLFTQPDRPIDKTELEVLRQAMRDKIAGKPTAYILGTKGFYGREFAVNPAVLIPRPETEELVEQVLKEVKTAKHVADFGAGSGCIGVTLAAELSCEALTLVDVSVEALVVARQNAGRLLADQPVQLQVSEGDFTRPDFLLTEKADVIVSNPPYVFTEEFATLDTAVRDHEPRLALVADNFEQLHRGLIAAIAKHLMPGGLFAIETHPARSTEVAGWAAGHGFVEVEIRNDFAGRPHFIMGRHQP